MTMKAGVRVLEFTRTPKDLKAIETDLNRQLLDKFPEAGPIKLLQTTDGELGVRMTMTVAPAKLGELQSALAALGIPTSLSALELVASNQVPIDATTETKLNVLIEELEALDDVDAVFTNAS